MKNYEKMAEDVLKRRDEEMELIKRKRKNARQIALSSVASVTALGIIVGAVDYGRYKSNGEGFIFQAFKNRGKYNQELASEGANSGGYTTDLAYASGEPYTNRQNVPDNITFIKVDSDFKCDSNPENLKDEWFQPMTLEELNNRYNIDFEALNDKYSNWRILRSPSDKYGTGSYGEYIDYGNDGKTAWKKTVLTENYIAYIDIDAYPKMEDAYPLKQVFVIVQQTRFPSYLEGANDPSSSVVAGWKANFYENSDLNLLCADVHLDYGYLRMSGENISKEEFIEDVRAVLKGEDYPQQAVTSDDIKFIELDDAVPFTLDDPTGLDPDKFRTLTPEELNKKYEIDFEALDGIYPGWEVGYASDPYGEYWESESVEDGYMEWPVHTQNYRFYYDPSHSNGISVIVQLKEFPSPDPNYVDPNSPPNPAPTASEIYGDGFSLSISTPAYDPGWTEEQFAQILKQNQFSIIEGYKAQFYHFKDEITRDNFIALVTLKHGSLYVSSYGIPKEEFVDDVRAILTGYVPEEKAEGIKHKVPENLIFNEFGGWDPYLNAGFDPEEEIDNFYPMTLDELNEKYGISFEALNGLLPEREIYRTPYGEFHSDEINWTENAILYAGAGYEPVLVKVSKDRPAFPDSSSVMRSRYIDGKTVMFFSFDLSDRFQFAAVDLDDGYLQVSTTEGFAYEDFIIAMKAILTGETFACRLPLNRPENMLVWPVGGEGGRISEVPYSDGGYSGHTGLDIAAPSGTDIYSVQSGVVTDVVQGTTGNGNYVVIKHDNGLTATYGHMSQISSSIYKGKRVEKYEVIGYVGSTGLAAGNQLHFEIQDAYGITLDPLDYLDVWSHSWQEELLNYPEIKAKRSEVLGY